MNYFGLCLYTLKNTEVKKMSEKREVANNHPRELFSITPSGFFGSGKENIVELENFMTEDEMLVLNHFAKNNKE
jgi:hypothetical protein